MSLMFLLRICVKIWTTCPFRAHLLWCEGSMSLSFLARSLHRLAGNADVESIKVEER